jgi:hypothetical protein
MPTTNVIAALSPQVLSSGFVLSCIISLHTLHIYLSWTLTGIGRQLGRRHFEVSDVMVLLCPEVLGLQIVGNVSIVEGVLHIHYGQHVLGSSIALLGCPCVCHLKPRYH